MEIAKLVISALTPLVVVFLGLIINKRLKDIEQKQWSNRKLLEKRIEVYDKISPQLNRLFCYFSWVGDWKNHTPLQIIETKRSLDHTVYIYRYLLEDDFLKAYCLFIDGLFETYSGAGKDARLRTHIRNAEGDRTKSTAYQWDEDWGRRFQEAFALPLDEIYARYEAFMQAQKKGIFS